MLAYLHQATPTEKENLVALLKHCQPIEAKNTDPEASDEKPVVKGYSSSECFMSFIRTGCLVNIGTLSFKICS